MKNTILIIAAFLLSLASIAQDKDSLIAAAIMKEALENSQLEKLAHEITDVIGPRLVGTPQMKKAHDWAAERYAAWGIPAKNEKWGEWRGWERGVSHIDLLYPRVRSLEGMQLAWSPSTAGKAVTGGLVILADVEDSNAFVQWLPAVKDKFVLLSVNQPTGRPDYNWAEFGVKASFERMKQERTTQIAAWRKRISKTGLSNKALALALERAGAAGILTCNWSAGFGVNKIFGASTKRIPAIDLSLEDYGLLYRLTEYGDKPLISVRTDSKETGMVPTYNTIAEIKGTVKPEQYVVLSAHFDSWDGASGATDNGTGTLVMMEAMRILKKIYPNPKRTILAGHWGAEEQGLNGSRAFVEDHPEIVQNIQAVFNQDDGTGRVVRLGGQGFKQAYDYLGRWLLKVPSSIRDSIATNFPGSPDSGGSDYVSFVTAGVPAFFLGSLNWLYGTYTWHTNRDTYDKIVFDDVRSNVILTAILAYMASEDPARTSRERIGQPDQWPAQRKAVRRGGVD